ncbi:AAA family ATPase [Leptolyngbya sp. AN02str]|uniref:AAA family ATPase n=1 Tax=Leptolyngbya sp. AN02str TaxID=3423363 RepID=UPI003D3242B0
MKPAIIAFSGSIASGKSTLSQEVAEALQWKRVSFGDYVRSIAQSRGIVESREVLQALGTDLLQRDTKCFCRAVLIQAAWQLGQPLIVDGIRHMEVLATLKQIVAPMQLLLVFVTVDEAVRTNRLLERGTVNLEKYQQWEQDSTEQQVKSALANVADLIIDSGYSLEESVEQLGSWLKHID